MVVDYGIYIADKCEHSFELAIAEICSYRGQEQQDYLRQRFLCQRYLILGHLVVCR